MELAVVELKLSLLGFLSAELTRFSFGVRCVIEVSVLCWRFW